MDETTSDLALKQLAFRWLLEAFDARESLVAMQFPNALVVLQPPEGELALIRCSLRVESLDEFRESMLSDDRLRSIDDFLSAVDVFPGVGLKGGVCYFLWDRDNPGTCRVTTHFKDEPPSTVSRRLLEEGVDVFIRFNDGLSILKKVVAVESGETTSLSLSEDKRFERLVSSRKPFGLVTTFKGKAAKRAGDVLVYQNGGTGYVARNSISTGTHLIDK
jgi:hypothetical protein